MTREEILKKEIESRYGSVRAFALQVGIPYMTMINMLKKGLGGTSVDTILTICKALGIDSERLVSRGVIEKRIMNIREVSEEDLELLTAFHEHPEFQDAVCKLLDVHFKLPKELVNTNEDKAD